MRGQRGEQARVMCWWSPRGIKCAPAVLKMSCWGSLMLGLTVLEWHAGRSLPRVVWLWTCREVNKFSRRLPSLPSHPEVAQLRGVGIHQDFPDSIPAMYSGFSDICQLPECFSKKTPQRHSIASDSTNEVHQALNTVQSVIKRPQGHGLQEERGFVLISSRATMTCQRRLSASPA